jgi:pimeloyl-ACP methyl ester carboxylesterase
MPNPDSDGVVLLHGIFRTRRSMAGLERFLKRAGYQVLNLGYRSTRKPIEELAADIHPAIENWANPLSGKIHFVGYSMGGLVARYYIQHYKPVKLGRVVLLGTPNAGSPVADFIGNWKVYRAFYGPAGQQLKTDNNVFLQSMSAGAYEVGCVAGNRSIDPISSAIIKTANDGKVSVESTKLPNMTDHIILPVSHTFMPTTRSVWEQVLHFILHGRFKSKQ